MVKASRRKYPHSRSSYCPIPTAIRFPPPTPTKNMIKAINQGHLDKPEIHSVLCSFEKIQFSMTS
jgi:hypothetical protein